MTRARPITVFYNRNFRTTYHAIEEVRNNPDGVPTRIIGSHVNPVSPMLTACDEAYLEPPETDPNHVHWLAELCRQREVDVFIPRAGQLQVAQNLHLFPEHTRVMTSSAATIAAVEDKGTAYQMARDAGLLVPDWRVVRNAKELLDAAAAMPAEQIIWKPNNGIGGEGFRILFRRGLPDVDISDRYRQRVASDFNEFVEHIATHGLPDGQPGIVQPYTDDPEISVDVIARRDASGRSRIVAAVPRCKARGERLLVDDPKVLRYAAAVVTTMGLEHIGNVQLRMYGGEVTLLESACRPAGGSYQAGMFAGVPMHWEAIRLALGAPERPLRPVLGVTYPAQEPKIPSRVADLSPGPVISSTSTTPEPRGRRQPLTWRM